MGTGRGLCRVHESLSLFCMVAGVGLPTVGGPAGLSAQGSPPPAVMEARDASRCRNVEEKVCDDTVVQIVVLKPDTKLANSRTDVWSEGE